MESEDIDPIEEIYERRRRLSDRFDNDPRRIGEFLMEYQKQFADRLISRRSSGSARPTGTQPP
ncbi:MAG TPA: hypothetical protein VFQ39_08620 [Longimicrobium sp.]|nr:hypothetical protein [Longimicrobium sp.]